MSAAEATGFLTLLRTGPGLSAKVYDSDANDGSGTPIESSWYVVVYSGEGSDSQTSLTGPSSTFTPTFNVVAVGSTASQVRLVMDRVDATLRPDGFGVVPTVSGRTAGPIDRDLLTVVDRDATLTPAMYFQTAEYSFESDPA